MRHTAVMRCNLPRLSIGKLEIARDLFAMKNTAKNAHKVVATTVRTLRGKHG